MTEMPLPTFDELPPFKNFPGCAWGVWGADDQLGTVNLLTEEVVQSAAREEIKPINFPDKPLFNRKTPEIKMIIKREGGMPRDDEIHIILDYEYVFTSGLLTDISLPSSPAYLARSSTDAKSMPAGIIPISNPNEIDPALSRIGMQNWATHGICGRGVLLDLVKYYHTINEGKLPYDPWTTHPISVSELEAVAKHQGVEFRQGDILLLRVGFIQKYYSVSTADKHALSTRPETFAGIEQSTEMKRFLWNNHFAAIASDQPALESWPAPPGTLLHQTILGLWGMPLGEFFDLEKLSQTCAETGRYTFFFSSWPLNIGNPIITMSRRESRSSLGARQNDALVEFENFKKKFLLANKHITKLNSTLSVRIEELNAQISMLYVENLRLRASEIALTTQLKKEREKSQKVIADAETATQNLAKHLIYLRETHNISTVSTEPPTPSSPRARRPALDISTSPTSQLNRISRPPNVPGIYEEDEPSGSSDEVEKQVTPPRKKSKSKPRLSTSKLPLPTRGPSPTPTITTTIANEAISASSKPRKTIRRQSGLLSVNTEALSVPRSGSPAFGSPIRLEAGRAEEAEEFAAVHGELEVTITTAGDVLAKREKRKGKAKEEVEAEIVWKSRDKKRLREEVDSTDILKPKVKDTTVPRTVLQPIDSNVYEQADSDGKAFLRPGSPDGGSAPTSRGSTSPAPTGSSELEGAQSMTGNRERRTRKSVNYAEPKLNTKMRKPDTVPGASEPAARKKRSSAAAVMTGNSYKPPSSSSSAGNDADADTNNDNYNNEDGMGTSAGVLPPLPVPLPLRGTNGNYINPELFPLPPSRPGSAAAMYSPGPSTRTTGSTTSGSSIASSTSTSSSNVAGTMVKKKSRPRIALSDDESDGAEADEEYTGGGAGTKGTGAWVNVEGRRKALPKRSAATAAVAALEDIRRHSMVI
ncbi:hypothetical protein CVT25_000986 [Psilocybe cyanescens]|uniref:Shugoshin C-terminal domain-containing protein n=1 Tax=Psilocybe cyanescens TaxID=93625 RepID=A0A409XMD0_PSICY|nr:hypothetical protein CVT25_000986 [Psilocybe cyanescens]